MGMVWLLGAAVQDALKVMAERERGIAIPLGGERPGGLRDKMRGEGPVQRPNSRSLRWGRGAERERQETR